MNNDKKKISFNTIKNNKLLLRVFPVFDVFLTKAWRMTCNLKARINEQAEIDAIKTYQGCVYLTWRQRMFYFFHHFGSRSVTMMIRSSRDGDYADRMALKLGISSVRGGTTKGGNEAIYELIDKLKEGGHTVAIIADGPEGPPRVLKTDAIKIAKETGMPIIPMMYGAKSRIVFKSWDRYFLPRPFTDLVVCYGNPILVHADANEEECESIRQEVERIMNEIADFCDTYWGGSPIGKPGFDLPAPSK